MLSFYNIIVAVLVILVIIIIIIVVRRKRRSRQSTNLASAAAQPFENPMYQGAAKLTDETVKNSHYAAAPGAATQENIYDNPEQSTSNTCDEPAGSYENPTNAYQNLPGNDHEYDVPKNKKISTSSLTLMRRKESKSRYERLSTVEQPGDDP